MKNLIIILIIGLSFTAKAEYRPDNTEIILNHLGNFANDLQQEDLQRQREIEIYNQQLRQQSIQEDMIRRQMQLQRNCNENPYWPGCR